MSPKDHQQINIVVVGAGKAGQLIAEGIEGNRQDPFNIIGFVDDAEDKQGKKIKGLKVLGKISDLNQIVDGYDIDEVFIAIPSERGKIARDIVDNTIDQRVKYKVLPRLPEVLLQDFKEDYIKYIRRVKAEDLLGGEILKSDQQEVSKYVKKQTILITGAAGSIGSELSRQLAAHGAQKIIFFDWWENGMFDLGNQIKSRHPEGDFEFIIGDIKNRSKLDQIMQEYKISTVFHAAAYKHVPLMEHNPTEAITNNIIGTKCVAELAIKNNIDKFVLVSSDKAVNPTNIMGATKRAAEKVVHILAESQDTTIFTAVRFGNVINSNGSVIPIFERQIEQGGPVTVTHKDITRFFMTIPEAAHLILQAWIMGENNDLFVLDMGEPIKIVDLAHYLIALKGYVPGEDIKVRFTGLRPGEKLYEEVLVKEEETATTSIEKVFRTKNYMEFDKLKFLLNLGQITESIEVKGIDVEIAKGHLKKMISTYQPKTHS